MEDRSQPITEAQTLMTKNQVATVLRISPRSVQTLVQRGDLAVVRIGRAVRFTRQAVERFIQSRTQPESR